ncbi:MAG: histidine kinase [Anaerocolumna sp.]
MKNKINTHKSAKNQIIAIMLLIVLPLLGVLILYNVYTLSVLNQGIAHSNEKTIYTYEQLLEKDMENIQYFISNSLANDSSQLRLNYDMRRFDAYMCGQEITKKYNEYIETDSNTIGGLFTYSGKYDMFRMAANAEAKYIYNDRIAIQDTILTIIHKEKDCYTYSWFTRKINNVNYILLILKNGTTYSGAFIDFNLIVKPQDSGNIDSADFMIYTSKEGLPLILEDYCNQKGITTTKTDSLYYITGKERNLMVVQKKFPFADINQLYISHYNGMWNYMDVSQIMLLIMSVLITLLLPLVYYLLCKTYFNPLNNLIGTMELIKEGNIEAKMPNHYEISEFAQVSKTFNEMIEQIKILKISSYEKEIKIKNAQLQYLQIQIRPHFFLNCLKNFYGLAQQKHYQQLQDMTLVLSDYLRRMFVNNSILIPVSDEVENVRNYIMLQQMSLSNPPQCNIDMDKNITDFGIPPLSILTFVENSVKHGLQIDRTLMISIRIALLQADEEAFVCITVLDNGTGYSEQDLINLNSQTEFKKSDSIGIVNVKKRINLIYNNKSTILFSNSNGACVEVYIPFINSSEIE